ncbi:hypothetical protein TIFTF001_039359 [Ficus carica]|uniref:TF-B3 domain-containing protein n=1 Tax=Ficus carica TaxID=3494 RepID=A0AA88EC80_FICCA|nr:hypothetical protein TIFTF001_039359 [Ficus carica]
MDLIEYDGDVWFTNGWSEFAQHHSLKNGQLLFFKYAGLSQFDAVILGKNGLEIDYPVLNSALFYESDIDDGSDDDDDFSLPDKRRETDAANSILLEKNEKKLWR